MGVDGACSVTRWACPLTLAAPSDAHFPPDNHLGRRLVAPPAFTGNKANWLHGLVDVDESISAATRSDGYVTTKSINSDVSD